MPCAVTPGGRVCGTAIGIAVSPTVSRTWNRSTSEMTAAMNRSQYRSGSGPASIRYGVPASSRSRWMASLLVVGLPVVLDEEHGRAAGAVVEQLVEVEAGQTVESGRASRCSRAIRVAEPASTNPVSA